MSVSPQMGRMPTYAYHLGHLQRFKAGDKITPGTKISREAT